MFEEPVSEHVLFDMWQFRTVVIVSDS